MYLKTFIYQVLNKSGSLHKATWKLLLVVYFLQVMNFASLLLKQNQHQVMWLSYVNSYLFIFTMLLFYLFKLIIFISNFLAVQMQKMVSNENCIDY